MRWIELVLLGSSTLGAFGQTAMLPEAPQPVAAIQVRDVRWDAVETLVPGESIELRDWTTGIRTECVLAYVNENAVACDLYDRGAPVRRVVYRHGEIDRVWVTRQVRGPSPKAFLIGAAVGATIGGIAGARASGSSLVGTGILLGGGLGSLIVLGSDPLGIRSHDQRVLIYRASKP